MAAKILPFKFKSTLMPDAKFQKEKTLTFLRNLLELVEQEKVSAVAYTYLIADTHDIVAGVNEETTHDEAIRLNKGLAYCLTELLQHMKDTQGGPP